VLRDDGLSANAVDGLVRRRQLSELLPGVYSPRPVPHSLAQRDWAAVLWSSGVLSHRSAARLWRLPTNVSMLSHVTVADRRFRELHPTVVLHRVPLPVGQCSAADGLQLWRRDAAKACTMGGNQGAFQSNGSTSRRMRRRRFRGR
jgi:hypothetical protein